MAQQLQPSGHLLEMFMPYRNDEQRMLAVIERAASFEFYKNLELPSFFEPANRMAVRAFLANHNLQATTFVTPYIKDHGLSLCDLDGGGRREAIELVKHHIELAADCGYACLGIPSGDDPGDARRPAALRAMADSMEELADFAGRCGLNLSIEPLDRYAYKKQLIGPIKECVEWFAPISEKHKNAFIHWDSAHEALGGIDLMESLEAAAPYIGQFHLCDCITDPQHPCFGDLHMEVASAPDWETEGFLTPEVGAAILRKVAGFEKPACVRTVFVAVEVLGRPGDNLWKKEERTRAFLKRCAETAGMAF